MMMDSTEIIACIKNELRNKGVSAERACLSDLEQTDELHVGGVDAIVELINFLNPTENMKVLDLGAGFSAPARWIVSSTGCHIIGIEKNKAFCDVGSELNRLLGFETQIEVLHDDISQLGRFPNAFFDAAWAIQSTITIDDKLGLFLETASVLKPGSRFVICEFVKKTEGFSLYPVPWADKSDDSFLVSTDDLIVHLTEAGFDVVTVKDRTLQCLDYLTSLVRQHNAESSTLALCFFSRLNAITRFRNLIKGLVEKQLGLVIIVGRRL